MIGEPLNRNKSIGISCMVFMAYVLFYMTGSNSGIHNYIQILLFALWNVTAYTEDPKSYFYAISSATLIMFVKLERRSLVDAYFLCTSWSDMVQMVRVFLPAAAALI